ncbi:MAG: M42 family metallopeptidase [Peptococcaceae bacterium]|nr:M42 family metallopeptidase [Peptococcaceae bacterium]
MTENLTLDYNLLKDLTQAYGPSGNEKQVAALIKEYAENFVDSVETDTLGNLILRKNGSGKGSNKKKIMIAAHMDEVGLIVTYIDRNGYLYFSPVGGIKVAELPGRRVMFGSGLKGVIARERKVNEQGKPIGKCFIDIGALGEKEARSKVQEGDMAILTGEFVETDSHIMAKALDDRLGCFIALQACKSYQGEHDLYFTFTVQEEVGARGAKTAAYSIEPDLALIIDTTISYDTPREEYGTAVNKGVAIKAMDRTIIVSPRIKQWMTDTADRHSIPYQCEVISTGGTDSGPVHLSKGGVPTGGLAVPVRYLHTASEVAAKADIEAAYALLSELLKNPLEI